MSLEENKAIARRCFDALNNQFDEPDQRDFTILDEVLSPRWAGEIKGWFPGLNRLWPDHHIEVTDMMAEGNMVWCRLATRATHCGEWEGIPANGRHWTNSGVWYLTIVDRKIVDIEWTFDGLNIVKQLGGTITPPQN
jgi:predicted ester cyclase